MSALDRVEEVLIDEGVFKYVYIRVYQDAGKDDRYPIAKFRSALWNRNYFLRFRFRLLKSYGTVSNFWKVLVPVPVPAPYLPKKILENFCVFLLSKLFYKEKVYKFQQIYGIMWTEKSSMKEIKYIILYLVLVPKP